MPSLKYLSFMGLQVFARGSHSGLSATKTRTNTDDSRRIGGVTLPVMFGPQCRVEYRPGFAHSADCDVDLVDELPLERTASFASNPGGSPGDEQDPFCAFWQGDDARLHAELCTVLDEAGIPHKTVRREDHLFNLKNFPAFPMGVPFSLFEKAETAVEHAYEADASLIEAMPSPNPAALIADRSRTLERLPEPFTRSGEENILAPPDVGDEAEWEFAGGDVEVSSAEDSSQGGHVRRLSPGRQDSRPPSRPHMASSGCWFLPNSRHKPGKL